MSRAEITRMAKEAAEDRLLPTDPVDARWYCTRIADLEAFAALVAAAERERQAKFCEGLWYIDGSLSANEFAAAVRANK